MGGKALHGQQRAAWPRKRYMRPLSSALASRCSIGKGSPCRRAASSSPHSSASVSPRAPMALQTHSPGKAAASTGPTIGKRSGAVQRTAAQDWAARAGAASPAAARAAGEGGRGVGGGGGGEEGGGGGGPLRRRTPVGAPSGAAGFAIGPSGWHGRPAHRRAQAGSAPRPPPRGGPTPPARGPAR